MTIIVICLLRPEYTVAYISINYEIVLIYIISALTLLYCLASLVMYAMVQKQKTIGNSHHAPSITNCAISVWYFLEYFISWYQSILKHYFCYKFFLIFFFLAEFEGVFWQNLSLKLDININSLKKFLNLWTLILSGDCV